MLHFEVYNKSHGRRDNKLNFKIREARMKAGMTQKDLAEKSGVSRSIINALETGKRDTTTTDTLTKLASAMGVKVSDIFFAGGV